MELLKVIFLSALVIVAINGLIPTKKSSANENHKIVKKDAYNEISDDAIVESRLKFLYTLRNFTVSLQYQGLQI